MRLPEVHALVLVSAVLALPVQVAAQAAPDSTEHRDDCRHARQVIETGHPAPHMEWALGFIGNCDRQLWGRTVATALRSLRTSSDLDELANVWADTQWLRDRHLFEAALEIGGDRSASLPARMFALRALLMLVEPGMQPSYAELSRVKHSNARRRWSCDLGKVRDAYMRGGVPLPADYERQAEALAKRIDADSLEPEELRYAAKCIDEHSD